MTDTPKKPIVPAIGYPIEGKHDVPPPGKKPPSRRTDGHGMTQSIDPRTPEGKRWIEKQHGAPMPAEFELKYDRDDCTLRQTPATWVTWGQLFCHCGGEIKSTGRGLTMNGRMEHQCKACGEKRWLDETFPRLMYEDAKGDKAPKQG